MSNLLLIAIVSELGTALLRSSALVAITGCAVWLVLKSTRVQSPVVKRYLALGILLQGCIFFRWTVELPWRDPAQLAAIDAHSENVPGGIPAAMALNKNKLLPQPPPQVNQGRSDITPNKPLDLQPVATGWQGWHVLFAVWATGIASIVGLAMLLYLRLWIQLRSEHRVSAEQLPEWCEALAAMGFAGSQRVSLRFTDRYGPSVVLLPRESVVLVPRDVWSGLNGAERLAVLRHELAHVQRHDLWKSLALRALALPHWFNPWAWWSVSLFEEAAEWACDEVAVAAGLSPRDYSRLLVQVSSTLSGYPARPLGASAAKLATRIAFLVERPARESLLKRLVIGTFVGLLLLANLINLRLVERSALAQAPVALENLPEIPMPAAELAPDPESALAAEDATAIVLDCKAVDEESGEPVAGAEVVVTWEYYTPYDNFEEQQRLRSQLQKTTTDEQGRYSVTLPAWTHSRPNLNIRVEMTRAGYLNYWDSKLVKEIVDADRTKQVATFQLAKLTAAREIIGRVVDPAGLGVEGVHLMKYYDKEPFAFPPDKQRRDIRDNESPTTDAEGRFRCQVPARGYALMRIRAFHDFVELPYEVTAERDQGDIRVNHGTRFSGRVLTSTGEPLANGYVAVQIPNINGSPNADCDADGRFTTEAFGIGKHIITVGWAGPPGTPRTGGATWIPPELYLPLEFELTGERTEIQDIEFRPIESVRVKALVVSFPAETGDQWTDLVMRLPAVEIRGQYRGQPWKGGGMDLHDDGSGKSTPPLAPRGLTDVELWFGDLPQRVQLGQNAPLLFGSAIKLPRLDADLSDLRIHRYEPSIVKLNLAEPHTPENVSIVGAYDREPEMRTAGMLFKTSEAPMPRGIHGKEVRYLVLPDEPLQFTIAAKGFQPRVEKMQLKVGETKSIDVKLIAAP